ncbi:MBL fold metallo-hydrolase [Egibacter rhizosphaerae]|uniref:MBL fold metallo-hydrolase n=1 Tax=Egibacter rhizosphaerae TaxID=1670831 RepID=A0A411YF66_9ACTN|nr:MBL fold metallo-hydrolase [Egibacter rhizosphaerae]QBI19868.1 MBL fold metallo-hydrolase [Egibacter rhizosphaerae]
MDVQRLHTPGLGDHSYLVTHEGRGVLIDPQRDVERFDAALAEADVPLRAVLETHLHNDYVSGAPHLASAHGAELVLPAAAGAAYAHRPAFHGEDHDLGGGLVIHPIHTPGHTPEHTSYLVFVDGEPVALFTGGSLLVGSAGRTDLVSEAQARQLARLQHGSLQRLAQLPGHVGVYPTHGEGSFCTATGAGQSVSDIAAECQANPALGHADAEAFADWQLAGLQPYPDFYARMGSANLLGRTPMPSTAIPKLDVDDVDRLEGAAELIDVRPRHEAAAGHIPGSQLIELGDDFGVWTGWVIDLDAPVVLVADEAVDVSEAVRQLGRIGIDDVRGALPIDAWTAAGRSLRTLEVATVAEVAGVSERDANRDVLDVRSPGEVADGTLLGAQHRYVPDLAGDPGRWLPVGRDPYVVCGSGRRAAIAAGLLARRGYTPVPLLDGGMDDVLAAADGT